MCAKRMLFKVVVVKHRPVIRTHSAIKCRDAERPRGDQVLPIGYVRRRLPHFYNICHGIIQQNLYQACQFHLAEQESRVPGEKRSSEMKDIIVRRGVRIANHVTLAHMQAH